MNCCGGMRRALSYAYNLVRDFSDNPKVLLGYFGLVMSDRKQKIIPEAPLVAEETWVNLVNNDGEKLSVHYR